MLKYLLAENTRFLRFTSKNRTRNFQCLGLSETSTNSENLDVYTMANPADTVTLEHDNGSKVTVHLHGATVISWIAGGEEILFCSKQAVFDNKKAIRGGIPLVFPQFGPWSLGPQHGFARIKRWQLEKAPTPKSDENDGHAVAIFSLTDDEDTRKMWHFRFKLLYEVCLGPDCLTLSLQVFNTGGSEFNFTTLMHSYFHVPDIKNVSISSLAGLAYSDKVLGGDHKEERTHIVLDNNYDRIYKNAPLQLSVRPVGGGQKAVEISRERLPDIVVWNPWEEKARAMSDFGDDEYKTMICVEAGAVSTPVTLAAGANITFRQKMKVVQPVAGL